MLKRFKFRKMGGSLGGIFAKEITDRMNVSEGDEYFIVETDRGLLLTPFDPTFEEAMEIYRRGSKKYRNALRELAK